MMDVSHPFQFIMEYHCVCMANRGRTSGHPVTVIQEQFYLSLLLPLLIKPKVIQTQMGMPIRHITTCISSHPCSDKNVVFHLPQYFTAHFITYCTIIIILSNFSSPLLTDGLTVSFPMMFEEGI